MSNSNSDFFGDLFASCCGERKPKKVLPKTQSSILGKPIPSQSFLSPTTFPFFFNDLFKCTSPNKKPPSSNPSDQKKTYAERTNKPPSSNPSNIEGEVLKNKLEVCGDLIAL